MLDEKRTLRSHPSLIPLRIALIAAERESPSRPQRIDTNEQLAMQLIARMRSRYKKADTFLGIRDHVQETAGVHV